MGFLKRLTGGGPGPDWAPFFSGRQYRTFLDVVEADLRRRGHRFTLGDGYVDFDAASSPELGQAGLGNLSQVCNQTAESEWPAIVARHFDTILTAHRDDADYAKDFEAARPLLKPRLYRTGELPEEAEIVVQQLGAGLIAVLSYDLPTSVRTVHRDDAAGWPVPIDALFPIAVGNLEAAPDRPERIEIPLDGGGSIQALQGDSFFSASEVMRLRSHAPEAPNGALAAVPNRHTLLYHPIVDMTVVQAVNVLVQMANGLYREGPGSISPELYWWHDGALTVLPASIEGKQMQFYPPDAFVEVLNRLASPG